MAAGTPTLHLICGKIAAGKSTLAARLADAPATVLISQDHWLSRLYPGEIRTLDDYVRCSARLREAMAGPVADLLKAGVSVVLDFPANTPSARQWMKGVIAKSGAAHRMHVLDTPDEVCKARLRARNAEGEHPYAQTTEADYELFSSHFSAPSDEEGFEVIVYPGP
jgi:predicted kinase